MAKQDINILLRSKILVGIVIPALFLLGVAQVVQGFVDTQYYRAQIERLVKEKTGESINIRGEVTFSLLPLPTLYMPAVELRGGTDKPSPALTIEMVYVRPSLGSLLSGEPQISSITLQHPILEIERAYDNVIHWGWFNTGLLQITGNLSQDEPIAVGIVGGGIVYRNPRADRQIVILNVNASGTAGNQPELSGSFDVYGHALQFSAKTQPGVPNAANGELPINIKISSDERNTLVLDGTVNLTSETPAMNGKITLDVENLLSWTAPKKEEKQELLEQITHESVQKEEHETIAPVKLTGAWSQSGSSMRLQIEEFQGINSAGIGNIQMNWVKNIPTISTDFDFSTLDYDQWHALFADLTKDNNVEQIAKAYQSVRDTQNNPLPADITVDLNIKAKQLYFNGQTWTDARLSTKLENAAITVNQLDIQLPGESFMSLFGIISHNSTRGLRFEGSMETAGKSLREMLTVFDESARDLPDTEFGQFYVRSNLYIAPDQVRLSEADAKISELRLNGGLVAYYDVIPRLEADVRLQDINFDYFRDAWRERQKAAGKEEQFFLQYDQSQNFNWLKKLKASIDFKVVVNGFTFLDRKGENASFRIFAREGEFGIYNMNFYYPTDTLQASFSLDVKGDRPMVNVLLNTNALDTRYFSVDPEAADREEKPSPGGKRQWSEDLIDMKWMEGISGAFDISIGNLKYDGLSFDHVKLRAKLEENLMTLVGLSFTYWQGRCSVNGSIYGGKVPGLSVGFTLYNSELQDILYSTAGRDNITGKVSVSGTLSTSGVNYLSWISQADAEMVFTGRGVVVKGFNLQGVSDAVAVSRTAADVFNNVNLSLVRGSTEMSIDGNINVKNGIMRTPGITIRSGSVTGNLSGDVKLVPWEMELSSFYQFPAMTSETIPTLTVQIVGPIDAPEMHVDTASLEAYVAKRLVGSSTGN